jgi:phosphoribosylformylglycinamidine synthase subunit PurQ / glutaminase
MGTKGDSKKLGIVVFPGSNCDTDGGNAWKELGLGDVIYLWHEERDLKGVDAILLPGGFSYGDALRAGALARFAPIMDEVRAFAERGNPIMGICNGFQILCEAGLLPGALTRNEHLRFICRPVNLKVETVDSYFTHDYTLGERISVPIAHGEGRYLCEESVYQEMLAQDRIAFRYVDEKGVPTREANPNGSQENIAGILGGPRRNVLGMMPHPERASSAKVGSLGGRGVLTSLFASLQ